MTDVRSTLKAGERNCFTRLSLKFNENSLVRTGAFDEATREVFEKNYLIYTYEKDGTVNCTHFIPCGNRARERPTLRWQCRKFSVREKKKPRALE